MAVEKRIIDDQDRVKLKVGSGAPAEDLTRLDLFGSDFKAGVRKQTDLDSFSLPRLKLNPDIVLEPASSTRAIEGVTAQNFPLDCFDPIRKIKVSNQKTFFVANDLVRGGTVLISVSNEVIAEDERQALLNDIRKASRFQHKNVVTVTDCGITRGGHLYLVSQPITGMTLRAYLDENGSLDTLHIIEIGLELCKIVRHAHEAYTSAESLPVENIILVPTPDGRTTFKIAEFGAHTGRSNVSMESEIAAIGDLLQEALLGSTKGKRLGPIQMPVAVYQQMPELKLDTEVENLLARTRQGTGNQYDSLESLTNDLLALKELLTYCDARPNARHQLLVKTDRKIAASLSIAVIVISLIFIALAATMQYRSSQKLSDAVDGNWADMFLIAPQLSNRPPILPDRKVRLMANTLLVENTDVTVPLMLDAVESIDDSVPVQAQLYSYYTPVADPHSDVFTDDQGIGPSDPYTNYGSNYKNLPHPPIRTVSMANCRILSYALGTLRKEPQLVSIHLLDCTGLAKYNLSCFKETPQLFKNLTFFSFRNTDVKGEGLEELKDLPHLEILELSDAEINDSHMASVATLPIRELILQRTSVTNKGLQSFLLARNLKQIKLVDNPNIKGDAAQLSKELNCKVQID